MAAMSKGIRPRILTDWPFQTYQTLASEKTTVVQWDPTGKKILSKMMKRMRLQVPYGILGNSNISEFE